MTQNSQETTEEAQHSNPVIVYLLGVIFVCAACLVAAILIMQAQDYTDAELWLRLVS